MSARSFRPLFALVFVLRIAIASQPVATYDAISYTIAAEAVASGQSVYSATNRYNYSPVWSWVVAALWKVADGRIHLFVLLLGVLLSLGDALSAKLLEGIARDGGGTPDSARRLALLFFANPISVLTSCYVRQFDGLSILLLLVAIRAASRPGRTRGWTAAAALSASLLVKHVTAFHPPLFWRRWRRGGLSGPLVLAPYAAFGLSLLPFAASSQAILDNVLLYGTGLSGSRGQRPGGFRALATFPAGSDLVFLGVLLAGVALATAAGRRRSLPGAALLVFLAQLACAPGFAAQYLVWPIALGSLFPSAGYVLLTTLGSAFMVADARLIATPVVVTTTGAWLAALFWFVRELERPPFEEAPDAVAGVQTSSTASG